MPRTSGTQDGEAGSLRSKRPRQHETVEELLFPQVHHEFLLWEGCNRDAKSRYNTRLDQLLPRHIYSPCVMNWDILNRMGCDGEIDDMLRIKVREAESGELLNGELLNGELLNGELLNGVAKRRVAKRRVAKRRVAKRRVAKRRVAKRRVAKRRVAKRRVAKRRVAKQRVTKQRFEYFIRAASCQKKQRFDYSITRRFAYTSSGLITCFEEFFPYSGLLNELLAV
ncbi:hypothetical protein Tco_1432460 [Tanacetum coccineum]